MPPESWMSRIRELFFVHSLQLKGLFIRLRTGFLNIIGKRTLGDLKRKTLAIKIARVSNPNK